MGKRGVARGHYRRNPNKTQRREAPRWCLPDELISKIKRLADNNGTFPSRLVEEALGALVSVLSENRRDK